MIKKNIYIEIREALKEEKRHMAIPQTGAVVIVTNEKNEILLVRKTSNKNQWVVPGGVQELGEDLKLTAKRELLEETGIDFPEEKLKFIDIATGEGRHKIYPNGDEVYNNTVIYWASLKETPYIDIESEDYMDIGNTEYVLVKESSAYEWFSFHNLPNDLNDIDLIHLFLAKRKENKI